ncbi:repetitive organellar protein-like [Pectinophora gossypiella]|uniref:repetitive organellar protein-like n=1 Tax=Pectinophora gossypiella TaxID=13191 RepID=UPI00214ECB61|nr:repetitive organellar protein-like [Pectinophora gossypiella]XP_049872175.1 repetitive organellar protein-like [Pectinophora gossypiella]
MDGAAVEHSDSDSGESWTLLESSPAYADDAPEFAEHPACNEGYVAENTDKDEDTDGISIISDSDPESTTPCELSYDKCLLEENRPTEPQISEFVSLNPLPTNNYDDHESVRDDEDFLGDNNGKLKTYVHRRNKRLSTVLNIIVLGSVITAAGVAIGHMWGARNDCSMNTTPSVNKILSNLYKLQEENAYLRNKIKELTFVNNMQMQQRKANSDKTPYKQNKCKKVFEESLTNRNAEKLTKCVDNEINEKSLESHMIEHEYEKELLGDIDKLKNIYQQNKSWLDEEIAKRLKNEEQYIKKFKNHLKSPKSIRINEEQKSLKDPNVKRQLQLDSPTTESIINVTEPLVQPMQVVEIVTDSIPEKRITYADSLKSGHKVVKRDIDELNNDNKVKERIRKKKPLKEYDTISEDSLTDDELKKDDRYVAHKHKVERKKNDRHKIHKKQKRRNKYEQWEMKGGYMKDYDDFSVPSSHENEYVLKNPDKNFLSRDFEQHHYINQFSEPVDAKKPSEGEENEKVKTENRTSKRDKNNKEKDLNWYDKRAALRTEARKKLEQELFGETTPNNAQWYFRRMQRREQCRVKGDNSTYKRLSKRIMNYKTKH